MSMAQWFEGALILPDRVVPKGLIRVEGSRITGVWDLEHESAPAPDEDRLTKLEAGYIAPGFIDLHVHGGGGADFLDGSTEGVAVITATHARYGTTGLLATTLTAPEEVIIKAVQAAQAAPRRGARVLGFHIEGPFINYKLKGAQDGRYVRAASVAEIDRWLAAAAPGYAWHVTLAPEIEGALEATRHLVQRGAVVSAGHTDSTYAQMAEAVAAGVSHATHLFNAMRGLHHREPGTVGAAMSLPGMTAELIADCVHVHPVSMGVAVRARGEANVILVTDAMEATGMPDGEYELGVLKTFVKNGEARLEDGTLAGSVLTMNVAVRNMVEQVGVSLPAAVAMASLNPARLHGLSHRKGAIGVGLDADLILLDEQLNVLATIVEGEVVFDKR